MECIHFNAPNGCRFGKDCKFKHVSNRNEPVENLCCNESCYNIRPEHYNGHYYPFCGVCYSLIRAQGLKVCFQCNTVLEAQDTCYSCFPEEDRDEVAAHAVEPNKKADVPVAPKATQSGVPVVPNKANPGAQPGVQVAPKAASSSAPVASNKANPVIHPDVPKATPVAQPSAPKDEVDTQLPPDSTDRKETPPEPSTPLHRRIQLVSQPPKVLTVPFEQLPVVGRYCVYIPDNSELCVTNTTTGETFRIVLPPAFDPTCFPQD